MCTPTTEELLGACLPAQLVGMLLGHAMAFNAFNTVLGFYR